jgi:hypothetical protein
MELMRLAFAEHKQGSRLRNGEDDDQSQLHRVTKKVKH